MHRRISYSGATRRPQHPIKGDFLRPKQIESHTVSAPKFSPLAVYCTSVVFAALIGGIVSNLGKDLYDGWKASHPSLSLKPRLTSEVQPVIDPNSKTDFTATVTIENPLGPGPALEAVFSVVAPQSCRLGQAEISTYPENRESLMKPENSHYTKSSLDTEQWQVARLGVTEKLSLTYHVHCSTQLDQREMNLQVPMQDDSNPYKKISDPVKKAGQKRTAVHPLVASVERSDPANGLYSVKRVWMQPSGFAATGGEEPARTGSDSAQSLAIPDAASEAGIGQTANQVAPGLNNSDSSIEIAAREQLHYTRPGEVIYILPEQESHALDKPHEGVPHPPPNESAKTPASNEDETEIATESGMEKAMQRKINNSGKTYETQALEPSPNSKLTMRVVICGSIRSGKSTFLNCAWDGRDNQANLENTMQRQSIPLVSRHGFLNVLSSEAELLAYVRYGSTISPRPAFEEDSVAELAIANPWSVVEGKVGTWSMSNQRAAATGITPYSFFITSLDADKTLFYPGFDELAVSNAVNGLDGFEGYADESDAAQTASGTKQVDVCQMQRKQIWGTVTDMGGRTSKRRPQFLSTILANSSNIGLARINYATHRFTPSAASIAASTRYSGPTTVGGIMGEKFDAKTRSHFVQEKRTANPDSSRNQLAVGSRSTEPGEDGAAKHEHVAVPISLAGPVSLSRVRRTAGGGRSACCGTEDGGLKVIVQNNGGVPLKVTIDSAPETGKLVSISSQTKRRSITSSRGVKATLIKDGGVPLRVSMQ